MKTIKSLVELEAVLASGASKFEQEASSDRRYVIPYSRLQILKKPFFEILDMIENESLSYEEEL